jgi:hypothetical protein
MLDVRSTLLITVLLGVIARSTVGQSAALYRVVNGETDSDGFPTTPARVCIGSGGAEDCYTPPPRDPPFGLNAKTQDVKLATGITLILFMADSSAGGSGSLSIIALLENHDGHLQNLLPKVTVSEQSEYGIWNLPNISAMPILVTADYVWAEGETHFAHHRYRISSYVYDKQAGRYAERDQFVTVKKYPGLDDTDAIKVLEPEKAKIVTRLQRK